jgi:hypothetical protein
MHPITRASILSAFVAALAACGGGGDDAPAPQAPAPAPSPAPAAVVEVSPSQQAADGLVAEANRSVGRVLQANAASGLPVGALITALPTGATVNGTLECSNFGTNGSGTVSYTYTTSDGTGQPVSYVFTYNNCTWSVSGITIAYNGTVTWDWTRYTSATDYAVTYAYDITYSYTGAYTSSGTIRSSATCVNTAGALSCSYNIDGARVRNNISITTSGTVTTVRSATVELDGTTSSGTLTITYDNWIYDGATGRATSGSVTVTDSRGNSAVVTATGTGYTVVVTYNGAQSTYTVAY